MKRKQLNQIDTLKNKNVLVIGDLILDHYIQGSCSRLSPEAPVPIVNIEKEDFLLGGAANVANNIVSLESKCYLCGIVGIDIYSDILKSQLSLRGINTDLIFQDPSRPTTIKSRVIGNNNHITRLDKENTELISAGLKKELMNKIDHTLGLVDVVIIEDYNKGLLEESLIMSIIKKCYDRNIKVIIDPKDKYYAAFKGAYCITPNLKEALTACNLKKDETSNKTLAKILKGITHAKNILITLSKDGMFWYRNDEEFKQIPTHNNEVCDVSGAGDTVIAVLSLAIAAGFPMVAAMNIANIAAGIVIKKLGCASTTIEEIKLGASKE